MLPALLPLCLAPLLFPTPQQPAPDPRTAAAAQANAQSAQLARAEDLLENGNFKDAQLALAALVAEHPHDARLQFDLGFAAEHNGDDITARNAYTAATVADPAMGEPRVALGLLDARAGREDAAQTELRGAADLATAPPALRARALRALARLEQAAHPEQGRADLARAIELTGREAGDAELTAALTAQTGNPADSEAGFRDTLATTPGDIAATVGLASVLEREGKLAEAEALLTPALAAHPEDPRLVAQTATLDAAEDKIPEAIALLQQLRTANAQAAANPQLTRLYAHVLLVSGDAAAAEPLYRTLAAAQPADPTLLDDLGSTLVREQKFADAQIVLTQAVAQRAAFHDDAAWGEAAGHLAFAASRNHQPTVVLQALQTRATVLPNSPATLFLEAAAHDSLHQKKEAQRAYRAFLAAAGGKLPNEEFEARHRLIALEHEH